MLLEQMPEEDIEVRTYRYHTPALPLYRMRAWSCLRCSRLYKSGHNSIASPHILEATHLICTTYVIRIIYVSIYVSDICIYIYTRFPFGRWGQGPPGVTQDHMPKVIRSKGPLTATPLCGECVLNISVTINSCDTYLRETSHDLPCRRKDIELLV